MECFKCHHENQKDSKFCSKCGKGFQRKTDKKEIISSHYPQKEALNFLKSIEEKKQKTYVKLCGGFLISIILSGSLMFITDHLEYMTFYIYFTIFLMIISLLLNSKLKKLSDNEYYTIPTSQDNDGQHHCIFCGNKGIYKNTIYKTNTTINSCSKCKEVLYYN